LDVFVELLLLFELLRLPLLDTLDRLLPLDNFDLDSLDNGVFEALLLDPFGSFDDEALLDLEPLGDEALLDLEPFRSLTGMCIIA